MFGAPLLDVIPIEAAGTLDLQDCDDIGEVLGTFASSTPAEFLDDDVFSGGKVGVHPWHDLNYLTSVESGAVVRIVAEVKQLDLKRTAFYLD